MVRGRCLPSFSGGLDIRRQLLAYQVLKLFALRSLILFADLVGIFIHVFISRRITAGMLLKPRGLIAVFARESTCGGFECGANRTQAICHRGMGKATHLFFKFPLCQDAICGCRRRKQRCEDQRCGKNCRNFCKRFHFFIPTSLKPKTSESQR